MSITEDHILSLAADRIISFGMNDASLEISRLNASYGLAKIIHALETMGIDSKSAFCAFAPDGGISRNKNRWDAGFSYGCYLRWPGPQEGVEITFPQVRPNACGVLVAKVKNHASYRDLCERLSDAKSGSKPTVLNGYKLNLGVSNHFIEVADVSRSNVDFLDEGDSLVCIHTSPSERKEQLYDCSYWEPFGGKWIETPFGPIFTLSGELARQYYEIYKEVDEFGKLKREAIAKVLFDDIEIVCNPTHQGLDDMNVARLGLYNSQDTSTSSSGTPLFPLTMRWDLPIYLLKGKPNVNNKVAGSTDLSRLNSKLLSYMPSLNILPHGSGYQIPFSSEGWIIEHNGGRRFFKLANEKLNYIFTSPSELPYYYRGSEVLDKIIELDLGEIAAELTQKFTLRY